MRKALLGTGLATAAAAVAGSVVSQQGIREWYNPIRKPSYVPPNVVFPIAWTALYVDIAATSAAVIDRFRADGEDGKARAYMAALGANLVLNAGWSWVFFGKRQLGPAVVTAAALAASKVPMTASATLKASRRTRKLPISATPPNQASKARPSTERGAPSLRVSTGTKYAIAARISGRMPSASTTCASNAKGSAANSHKARVMAIMARALAASSGNISGIQSRKAGCIVTAFGPK